MTIRKHGVGSSENLEEGRSPREVETREQEVGSKNKKVYEMRTGKSELETFYTVYIIKL